MNQKITYFLSILVLLLLIACNTFQEIPNTFPKELPIESTPISISKTAATYTQKENTKIKEALNFQDRRDFNNAEKGFIATREDPIIKTAAGAIATDLRWFDFLDQEAPSTVNPSLWRQSQLNKKHGLFEVTEGIYQVRGFDLANMTVVATDEGWIVIDPLTTEAVARAAMKLVDQHLGKKPIKAVIITHSHLDHFGGIKGIVSQKAIDEKQIEIIAPEGFYESAISENIIAGNAMKRRAMYMFGYMLPIDTTGFMGNGLGQKLSTGKNGILPPTITIHETGQQVTIDGLDIIFQNTPEAEAPAECMFYFPKYRAFCQAEEINHNLHNLYTLRGAEVRNGLKWAKYIDESIQLFGDKVDVSFGSHHWPTWGKADILELWTKQRDVYKYIHDQTLYLANSGHTMNEIAEQIQLPKSLSSFFANRGYYGTLSHNAKAQYQLYYGWFDGNPANLDPLPPDQNAKKYVEYMGGAAVILEKVQTDIANGNYRWAATILNHLVFAEPENQSARNLLSNVYTQMAYSAESGPWRNFYLTGAQELEHGIITKHLKGTSTFDDVLLNMPLEKFYDYLAVRLDRSKSTGKKYTFNLVFPDIKQHISLYLENEVLHNRMNVLADNPTATITMDKSTFNDILLKKVSAKEKMADGSITIKGDIAAYADFQRMVSVPFPLMFNLIEP